MTKKAQKYIEKIADMTVGPKDGKLTSIGLYIGTKKDHKKKSEEIGNLLQKHKSLQKARKAYLKKYPNDFTTVAAKKIKPSSEDSGKVKSYISVGKPGGPAQNEFYNDVIKKRPYEKEYTKKIGSMTKKAQKAVESMMKKEAFIVVPGPTEMSVGPFKVDEASRKGLKNEHDRKAPVQYSAAGVGGGFMGSVLGAIAGSHKDDSVYKKLNKGSISPIGRNKYTKTLAGIGALTGAGAASLGTKAWRDNEAKKIEEADRMRATANAYGRDRVRQKLYKRLEKAKNTKEKGIPDLKGFKAV